MTELFKFGEDHAGYPVRVLNEREARGAAGIMFLFALIAFMNAWFKGDFTPTKLTIVAFFLDFFIRVIVNPRYSPTLIMARWMVNNQTAEYAGAPQKRFAWAIGASMICLCLVFFHPEKFAGALNALTRHALLPTTEQYLPRWLPLVMVWLCLGFMWLEAILGFCVGCKIHALLVKLGVLQDPCEACNSLDFG